MFIIQFSSGGQQPKEFDSLFTSTEEAIKVIEKYIESREQPAPEQEKIVTNGTAKRKQAI